VDKLDRLKPVAASYSADVWSVGCLFYELLFGQFLFDDPDWTQFFVRVTKDILPIASDTAAAAMEQYPLVSAFLSFALIRNPNMRPSVHELVSKFDDMFGQIMGLPSPVCSPSTLSSSTATNTVSEWPRCVPSSAERAAFFGSLVPVQFYSSSKGRLHTGCWPLPAAAAQMNLVVLVASDDAQLAPPAFHHALVNLKGLNPPSSPSLECIVNFRSILKPCLDAVAACLLQGGDCAICSSEGTGCSDVVTVAAAVLCSQGMSLLQALQHLRQAVVIESPQPQVLNLIHAAFCMNQK
jgi:serine/threonine protein kinase